jgi:hypothetical protein
VGTDEGPAGVDAKESRQCLACIRGVWNVCLALERRHFESIKSTVN